MTPVTRSEVAGAIEVLRLEDYNGDLLEYRVTQSGDQVVCTPVGTKYAAQHCIDLIKGLRVLDYKAEWRIEEGKTPYVLVTGWGKTNG